MVAVEAVAQGFEHGGLQGAAYGGMGAAALYMLNSFRQAGIKRTSDLYRAALADPELARTLISKMPTKADSGTMLAFSRALKRSLILGPIAVATRRRRPGNRCRRGRGWAGDCRRVFGYRGPLPAAASDGFGAN